MTALICDMEKHGVFLLLVVLPLAAISSALAENKKVYVAVGDKIKLTLVPPVPESIYRIFWKHGVDLVAEWTNRKFTYYGAFKKNNTKLEENGRLEITNASKTVSGVYEVEVNNKVQDLRYDVIVIGKVPKPKVRVAPLSCDANSNNCKLICDGSTEDAEPVSYSWKTANGDWEESTKDMVIGNETEHVKSFSCQIKNPVSVNESDHKDNPFFKVKPTGNPAVGVGLGVFFAAVLVVLGGLAYWKRDSIKSRFSTLRGTSNGDSGDRKTPSSTERGGPSPGEGEPLNRLHNVESPGGQSEGRPTGTSDEKEAPEKA